MKIRKTRKEQRINYTYQSADGKKLTLKAGESGVTEVWIEELHRMDDNKVNNNLKNARPERTKKEKAAIKKWKQDFREKFKAEHGYYPTDSDVEDAADEEFPKNYNLSYDWKVNDDADWDSSEIAKASSHEINFDSFNEKSELRIKYNFLTDIQFEVLYLSAVEGYSLTEIAQMLETSIPNISKHLKKAKKRVIENKNKIF